MISSKYIKFLRQTASQKAAPFVFLEEPDRGDLHNINYSLGIPDAWSR